MIEIEYKRVEPNEDKVTLSRDIPYGQVFSAELWDEPNIYLKVQTDVKDFMIYQLDHESQFKYNLCWSNEDVPFTKYRPLKARLVIEEETSNHGS